MTEGKFFVSEQPPVKTNGGKPATEKVSQPEFFVSETTNTPEKDHEPIRINPETGQPEVLIEETNGSIERDKETGAPRVFIDEKN